MSVLTAVAASLVHSPIYRCERRVVIDREALFYAFNGLDNQIAYAGSNAAVRLARSESVFGRATKYRIRAKDRLQEASSVRVAGGDASIILFSVDDARRGRALSFCRAYAAAFVKAAEDSYASAARRVLPRAGRRVYAARGTSTAPAVVKALEQQFALLQRLRETGPARVVGEVRAKEVWPRPFVSAAAAAGLTAAFCLGLGLAGSARAGRRLSIGLYHLIPIGAVGAVSLGVASAWIDMSSARASLLATGALAPLLVALAAVAAPVLAGLVVFAQVFEGYSVRTPVATLSAGAVALVVLVVWRAARFDALLRNGAVQVLAAVLGVLVASHALQFLHVAPYDAVRGLVTAGGLALFWSAGLYIARQKWGMTAVGVGSFLGLLVLGGAGIAVGVGLLPNTNVASTGRTFFGFESPFPRTYGISTGTLPSLLLPLCIPWLTLILLRGSEHRRRVGAAVGIIVVLAAVVLLFQSRSMLLQIVLGTAVTAVACRLSVRAALVGAATLVAAGAVAAPSLLFATDRLSTLNRWDSYQMAVEFFARNPSTLLLGTDATELVRSINAGLEPPQPPNAPIHDTFIQFVAQGGLLAAVAAAILLVVPFAIWVIALVRGRIADAMMAWIPAVTAMLAVESVSFALVSDAGNGWIALGMLAGYAASLSAPALAGSKRSTQASLPGMVPTRLKRSAPRSQASTR